MMATSEMRGFLLAWRIENHSFSWHEEKNQLLSPEFLVNKTRWRLGMQAFSASFFFNLLRENDHGPDVLELDCEFFILDRDGSPLKVEKNQFTFEKGWLNTLLVVSRDEMLQQRNLYLPQDTLTVRCRVWEKQGSVLDAGQFFARTQMKVERRSFIGEIKNNSWLSNSFIELNIISAPQGSAPFSVKTSCHCDSVIYFQITTDKYKFSGFVTFILDLFLLDKTGNKMNCGQYRESFVSFTSRSYWQFPSALQYPGHKIYNTLNKQDVPIINVVALQFHISYSSKEESKIIEKSDGEFVSFENVCPVICDSQMCDSNTAQQGSQLANALKDDMLSLFNNPIFCDTHLRTATETFPVHKVILSTRSPVFRAMFTNDMREKSSKCVDTPDLNSDTVRRMLLFMYTDTFEDMEWESARDLYSAADKYGIICLKHKCSTLLKKKLQVSNFCDVLLLADLHQDEALKDVLRDFILNHFDEVLRSSSWCQLEKTNSQLSIEILRSLLIKTRIT